ncbi:hypothetical protein MTR67_052593 [Solanum verrucosum]|uniref:Gag-pol polyprotein n=1 Tax=Solanum verrucosum TaxID=315347 RepID=A0AAF1A300_SOLVR|nr:hypothetical protein MTR67_052593 [Solanum verrucosum]
MDHVLHSWRLVKVNLSSRILGKKNVTIYVCEPRSSNDLAPKFNKYRLSNPKPQGGNSCNRSSTPACTRCGKKHGSKCLAGTDGCFKCGKSGHKMRDCLLLATKDPAGHIQGFEQTYHVIGRGKLHFEGDIDFETPTLESVSIVNEFPKVLLDDLLSTPPKKRNKLRFIAFLGHIISGEGIQVDPNETKLTGYYRRFVEGFSSISSPLTMLTQNKFKIVLCIRCEGYEDLDQFWKLFQKGLGTQVKLSTTFHPQTDGQAKRTIQTLMDMLRACIIGFKGNWDDHLPLIKFTYNNSYHSSIGMAPFETFYWRRCRSWFEVGEFASTGPKFVHEAMEKVQIIPERLKKA